MTTVIYQSPRVLRVAHVALARTAARSPSKTPLISAVTERRVPQCAGTLAEDREAPFAVVHEAENLSVQAPGARASGSASPEDIGRDAISTSAMG
ncbi:hypothetical protein J8I87_08300 [Paraburkholderia sp. LEh10]|jgi:hypothetical protein|uniref:hypothetical protein n=1 Tax=Paraburkholderia sp. LEh10 TaxID=2821353 RepID=UPI001AE9A5DD|nr:hypothetical protein [Paraburkholderia sp. LEh10]MBP0589716.1 hypothetical protein [Paraburkholderia sp. LEh10]